MSQSNVSAYGKELVPSSATCSSRDPLQPHSTTSQGDLYNLPERGKRKRSISLESVLRSCIVFKCMQHSHQWHQPGRLQTFEAVRQLPTKVEASHLENSSRCVIFGKPAPMSWYSASKNLVTREGGRPRKRALKHVVEASGRGLL